MRLVLDAGPIIARSKTGHLELLSRLSDEVVVPAAVLVEVAPAGETRPGSEIGSQTWVSVRSVSASARVELQTSSDIAAGEAEAILIAAGEPDASVLLVDERRARRIAIARGVRTLRTGALLVAAARRGLLQPGEVRTAIEILQHERYLDARAVDDILALDPPLLRGVAAYRPQIRLRNLREIEALHRSAKNASIASSP